MSVCNNSFCYVQGFLEHFFDSAVSGMESHANNENVVDRACLLINVAIAFVETPVSELLHGCLLVTPVLKPFSWLQCVTS